MTGEIMTLADWLLDKYGDNKAWQTGGNIQKKKVDVKELLSIYGREELFCQVKQLEKEGFLYVKWCYIGSDIEWMKFPMEQLNRLYQRQGRENPRIKSREQQEYIQTLLSKTRAEWLQEYYNEQLKQMKKGNKANKAYDNDFLRCLFEISELKNHTWERMFSEAVFHDSKKFQQKYRDKVVKVLKKVLKERGEELEKYEILAEFGIMNYSQCLSWKGRMIYEIDGVHRVDTENQLYGTVLNAQTLVNAKPVLLPGIKQIMTIENQANYEDRKYSPDTLYIFVHGFLSPKERRFLKYLCDIVTEDVKFYHWGDMDLGGMRIFQFLKEELFPKIQPYKMDVESYRVAVAEGKGIPFDEEKRKKYEAFDAKELEPLKQCILAYGKDMEQEGIQYDIEG